MKSLLKTLFSFVLAALSFYLVYRNWYQAATLTLSILIHEVGHWGALLICGVKSDVYLVPFLGGITVHNRQADELLSDSQRVFYLIAGPVMSALLMIAAMIAMQHGALWAKEIANLNAILLVINLLPMGEIVDGGKIALLIAKNFTKQARINFANIGIGLPVLGVYGGLAIFFDWSLTLTILTFALWAMVWRNYRSDVKELEEVTTIPKKYLLPAALIHMTLLHGAALIAYLVNG